MTRDSFLRSALIAPLLALVGCRREPKRLRVEAPKPVVAMNEPIQATAWTFSSGTTSSATLWVQTGDGTWTQTGNIVL